MFISQARLYTNHLKFCKISSKIKIKDNNFSKKFVKEGFCTFKNKKTEKIANEVLKSIKKEEKSNKKIWENKSGRYISGDILKKFPILLELFDGEVKDFINQVYKSNFSIFYGILYKSTNSGENPKGSQLWHIDGGPGTCINFMFCLSEINQNNGSMKCLPWHISKSILLKLFKKFENINNEAKTNKYDKVTSRNKKSKLLNNLINNEYSSKIFQPTSGPGLVYAFRNNCIHSGGYPELGFERYVCVFHIYPSPTNIEFKNYIKSGVEKNNPYPLNPFEIKN